MTKTVCTSSTEEGHTSSTQAGWSTDHVGHRTASMDISNNHEKPNNDVAPAHTEETLTVTLFHLSVGTSKD